MSEENTYESFTRFGSRPAKKTDSEKKHKASKPKAEDSTVAVSYTHLDVYKRQAMNLMGMNVGPLRMPLCEMEEGTKAALAKEIEKFGLKLAK